MSTNNNNDGVIRRRSVFSKKDYYFLFGQMHKTVDGVTMKDRWVRVRARNERDAKIVFENEFTSKYMPSVNSYSRSVSKKIMYGRKISNSWLDPLSIFPEGEYMFFDQKYIP